MAQSASRAFRLLRWLGPLLLVGLIFYAGPRNLLAALGDVRWEWLGLAWLFNLPQLGLKALRWQRMVHWQGVGLTRGRAILAYGGALLLGFLTPGRLGEMAKAFTLRHDYGMPLAGAFSSVLADRLFDLYLLITLGLMGVVRFTVVGELLPWPVFLAACVVLFLPLLFLNERVARGAGAWAAGLPVLCRHRETIEERVGQFADGLKVLSVPRLLICTALTVCSYAIFFLQCECCARALGFTVPYVDMAMLMAATNVMTFVPISISGLGTREACLILFFGALNPPLSQTQAVALGMAIFLVMFVGGGLLGLIAWHWAPMGLRRAAGELRRRGTTTAPTEEIE